MLSTLNSWGVWLLSLGALGCAALVSSSELAAVLFIVSMLGNFISMGLWDLNKRLRALEDNAAKVAGSTQS